MRIHSESENRFSQLQLGKGEGYTPELVASSPFKGLVP